MFRRNLTSTISAFMLLGAASLLAAPASAELTLNSESSSVTLISYKVLAGGENSVSERHHFTQVTGTIDESGQASVSIPLATLETGIPIRNERLSEFVFEVSEHPDALIEASVPKEVLDNGLHRIELEAQLTLHGKTQTLALPVVIEATDQSITAISTEPVMLNAADFDLDGGIGKLAELAKLLHIPTSVPVSFILTFDR